MPAIMVPAWPSRRFATVPAATAAEEADDDYEEGDDERSAEDEAILDYFLEMDNAEKGKATPLAPLPAKVSGIAGGLAAELYRSAVGAGNFSDVVYDLFALNKVVEESPDVITRFFKHNNYSEVECALAVDLLTTGKYANHNAIPTQDQRETIVGAPENFQSWADAKKAIDALELEDVTKAFIGKLAKLARLDLLKSVASTCADLQAAASKTVPVVVSSAVALSPAQKERISKLLPKYAGTQAINVEFEVDPSTLGGLMITLENRSIDLSASSKLMEVVQEYN